MITNVYFVRHAQSDISIRQEDIRPLTAVGKADSKKVSAVLLGKGISKVYSSPYLRAVETVRDLANSIGTQVILVDDFRERRAGGWVDDFFGFAKQQWQDLDHRNGDGESLREVQTRNIAALEKVIKASFGESIAIGTHGTALGTIINYYDSSFGYGDFCRIVDKMPYILHFTFDGLRVESVTEVELP